MSPSEVVHILASKVVPLEQTWPDTMETVIFDVRLPRALAAMLVGAGLSVSGASFQGLFKNPLVSPQILGVASGAGFGAALVMLLSDNLVYVQLAAFSFGLFAVICTYMISKIYKTRPVLTLVLAGIVVGAFFQALTSMIKYIADPWNKLPAITFWLMGSFNAISLRDLAIVGPIMLAGILALMLLRWRINVLSLGEEEARSMGVNTEQLRMFIILAATVVTASSVCVSGIIGWVGLIIPHVGRMLVGPDHTRLLPATFMLGASYLLIIDNLSRSMFSAEIPIGILTAILGAPFFAYILRNPKAGWSR